MTAWPLILALVIAGYLLGAIPFCFVIGRLYGVDLRTIGSRNIGGTNLRRGLKGKPAGGIMALTGLVLDSMKGFIAALWLPLLGELVWQHYQPAAPIDLTFEIQAICAGVAAVVGHSFTFWLGFKGGKGVATGLGAFLVVCWPAALIGLAVFGVMYLITRIMSVGSLAGAVAVPVAAAIWWHYHDGLEKRWPVVLLMLAMVALVFVRHRSNIQRLMRGEELSFREPRPAAGGATGAVVAAGADRAASGEAAASVRSTAGAAAVEASPAKLDGRS